MVWFRAPDKLIYQVAVDLREVQATEGRPQCARVIVLEDAGVTEIRMPLKAAIIPAEVRAVLTALGA